ncbi:MAG TPA: right-handed parallel beta-helix repeat-containing protein [Solirubrobacteraceae bacterium]|nr:right-handed parallel beta-helix repeat-containing protein [Solirubrobacteraceae bacterium]
MTRFGVWLVAGGLLLRATASNAACSVVGPLFLTYPGAAPCDTTLQACIDAAPCDAGVVEIATEQLITDPITFEKGLTLRAAAGHKPVLLGPLSAATPTATSKGGYYIRIEGLTFEAHGISVRQNSPSAVDVEVVGNTVRNGAPEPSWVGIDLSGGTGTGVVGFEVSGNKVTIEGESSEIGIGIADLPIQSYGRIANNSLSMEHNEDAGAIRVLEEGAGPWSVDVVANRVSGIRYGFGINLHAANGAGTLTARLLDNLIVGQAGLEIFGGGAVVLEVSDADTVDATVVNNTITGNEVGLQTIASGGMHRGLVANNVISGNSQLGLGISNEFAATLANRYNLVFGNGLDHFTPGPGTIARDPQFPGSGDYHIQGGSPAIDAGDDGAVPGDLATDLDGRPRILGAHADLGAYEAEVVVWPGHAPCDATLQACIDAVLPGDEVQIAKNDAIAEDISFAKSLTLRAAPGFAPVLTSFVDASPTLENDFGYRIRIEGLRVEGGIQVDQESPSPLTAEVVRNTSEYGIVLRSDTGPARFDLSDNAVTGLTNAQIDVRTLGESIGRVANNSVECSDGTGIAIDALGPSAVDVIGNRISGTDYSAGIVLGTESVGSLVGALQARILDNLVIGASAGPGISLFQTTGSSLSAIVVNNTIAGNEDGFVIADPIHGEVANNIVSGNTRYGVSIDPVSAATFTNRNNLVFDNGMDSFTPGPETITLDPHFVGNGNYHLQAGSPATDAGNDGSVPADLTTDLDGAPRIRGAHVDIGPYETAPEPATLPAGGAALLALHALGRRTHAHTGSCWRRR